MIITTNSQNCLPLLKKENMFRSFVNNIGEMKMFKALTSEGLHRATKRDVKEHIMICKMIQRQISSNVFEEIMLA